MSLLDDRPAILLNESPRRHWLRIELEGKASNRSAIGAAVTAWRDGRRVAFRQVKGGGSYLSANDPRILIGLGNSERLDRVEIAWPSGTRTTLNSPAARPHAPGRRTRPWAGLRDPHFELARPAMTAGTLVRAAGWAAVAGLSVLNGWWAWRGRGVQPDLSVLVRKMPAGEAAAAEAAIRERIRQSPHDGDAQTLLANLLATRGDSLGAARAWQAVPYWWPGSEKTRVREGQAFKALGRMDDAEAAWKELAEFDPLHPVPEALAAFAVRELLELYSLESRWEEAALSLLWKAHDHASPGDRPGWLLMRMRTEIQSVPPAQALHRLTQFLAASPDDHGRRAWPWFAVRALGHRDEAAPLLGRCLRERTDDPRVWAEHLAAAAAGSEDASMSQALAAVPDAAAGDAGVLEGTAKIYESRGDWAAAAETLRRLISLRGSIADDFERLANAEDHLGLADRSGIHRERARSIRDARAGLNSAIRAFAEAIGGNPSMSAAHAAAKRLAGLCEALGWDREADAWAQLAMPG